MTSWCTELPLAPLWAAHGARSHFCWAKESLQCDPESGGNRNDSGERRRVPCLKALKRPNLHTCEIREL